MQFKENQTIYLQIAERISDEILLGHYAIGSRIPSVREYAALVEVNANTVMRSYEFLQTQGIIFNKRGIGFFVSPDAKIKIKSYRRSSLTLPLCKGKQTVSTGTRQSRPLTLHRHFMKRSCLLIRERTATI